MHSSTGLTALAVLTSTASAATFGFNYGGFTGAAGAEVAKTKEDFASAFEASKGLPGTNGKFSSARLYSMIQQGSANDVIEAIPAAIESNTRLLLGMWASGGEEGFQNELSALRKAIDENPELGDLCEGISIGSEDLYRDSETGRNAADADVRGPGVGPEVLLNYIQQTQEAIRGTGLANCPLGHVDTWTAWANSSNSEVAAALSWIGTDAYPYFQDTMPNDIDDAYDLFKEALEETAKNAAGADVWITETGWPVRGAESGSAVASTDNAEKYWKQVACKLIADDNMNTWWYTLYSGPTKPNPTFDVLGSDVNGAPVYDLSCDDADVDSLPSLKPGSGGSSSNNNTSSGSNDSDDDSDDSDDSDNNSSSNSGSSSGSKPTSGSSSSSGSSSGSKPTGSNTTESESPVSTGSGSGSSGSGAGSNGTVTSGSPAAGPSGAAGAPDSSTSDVAASSAAVYSFSMAAAIAGVAALFL